RRAPLLRALLRQQLAPWQSPLIGVAEVFVAIDSRAALGLGEVVEGFGARIERESRQDVHGLGDDERAGGRRRRHADVVFAEGDADRGAPLGRVLAEVAVEEDAAAGAPGVDE